MGLVITIIIGFLVGVVAKLFIPGPNPRGCLITSLLGIGGAWVGQRLIWAIGLQGSVGFIGSVVGAMVILLVYHALTRKKP